MVVCNKLPDLEVLVQRDPIIQSLFIALFPPGLEKSFNQVVGVINDPMCLGADGGLCVL